MALSFSSQFSLESVDYYILDNDFRAHARSVIQLLPEELYGNNKANVKSYCPICYIPYENGSMLRRLPCMHAYHTICIDKWLERRLLCPICRMEVSVETSTKPGLCSREFRDFSTNIISADHRLRPEMIVDSRPDRHISLNLSNQINSDDYSSHISTADTGRTRDTELRLFLSNHRSRCGDSSEFRSIHAIVTTSSSSNVNHSSPSSYVNHSPQIPNLNVSPEISNVSHSPEISNVNHSPQISNVNYYPQGATVRSPLYLTHSKLPCWVAKSMKSMSANHNRKKSKSSSRVCDSKGSVMALIDMVCSVRHQNGFFSFIIPNSLNKSVAQSSPRFRLMSN